MDKIGLDKVNAELREKGITEEAIVKLQPILNLEGSNSEKLEKLKTILQDSPIGLKGVEELHCIRLSEGCGHPDPKSNWTLPWPVV